jgi:hypothetical protein
LWVQRLFALHGSAREQSVPFFVAPGARSSPLTYQTAMRHVRSLWAKASSPEEAHRYGLHSLRVAGYTLAKRSVGEALAVAQGGWRSDAHERYERFTESQVLDLPMAMVAGDSPTDGGAQALPVTPVVREPPAAPVATAAVPARPMTPRPRMRGTARSHDSAEVEAAIPPPTPSRTPRPLTFENAVGRRVLAPASLWPRYPCKEHGGEGWEANISKVRTTARDQVQEGLVEFVARRTRSASGWAPVWLPLATLRPLR